jgi:hypothetical protein
MGGKSWGWTGWRAEGVQHVEFFFASLMRFYGLHGALEHIIRKEARALLVIGLFRQRPHQRA